MKSRARACAFALSLTTPRESEVATRGTSDAETLYNAVAPGPGSMDAHRFVLHAELLLLRLALRSDFRAPADTWSDARMGASILAVVGGARAGDLPVYIERVRELQPWFHNEYRVILSDG